MTFTPVPYVIDHAALEAGGNFGLALSSGRLVATVVSQRSGKHVSVQLRAKVKVNGRFRGCELHEAERLFIDVPSQGCSGFEIGQLHLAGRWAGKILPPWEEDFDEARVWAARRVLDVAHGRAPVADDMATIAQGRECLMCGRELTDPESISRDIGPECWKRATGSIKDEHGSHQRPGDEKAMPTEVVNGSKPGASVLTREQIEAELQQEVVEESKPEDDLSGEVDGDVQLFLVPADADPRDILAKVRS